MSLTLTVTPTDLGFSQHAEVRLEVVAEPGVTVRLDDYDRAIRESKHRFEVGVRHSAGEPPAPRDDGRLISTYRYQLGFFVPGEYELPPATLTFVDERGGGELPASVPPANRPPRGGSDDAGVEGTGEQLQTEPITVTGRDEPDRHLSPEELRTITTLPPIELPTGWSRWWRLVPPIAMAAVVAVVLLVRPLRQLLWRCLHGQRRRTDITVPAHVWARQQLAALIAEDLLKGGLVREFHDRISHIVRRYLERRYGVSAGQMTTEELLEAAGMDDRFGSEATAELKQLLPACDLVKYARHEPTSPESQGALRTAEALIERTRERSPVDAPGVGNRPSVEGRAL